MPVSHQAKGPFTDHLVENLALCVAPQPSSPDLLILGALYAAHAIYDPVLAAAQFVPTDPCRPKNKINKIIVIKKTTTGESN